MATSKKITELDQLTTAANADLLYIVHDPANIPTSKKITVSDLLKTANTYANSLATAAYTNAVAYANSVATTKAANAYSNAVTYAASVATNAYNTATDYTDSVADSLYTNVISQANSLAANAYSNALAYFAANPPPMLVEEKYFDYVNGSLNGSGGLGNQFSGLTDDDTQYEIPLPFAVTFLGNTYNSVWIHSNSYLAFGAVNGGDGSPYYPLGPQRLGVPAIMLGSTDRQMTAYYYDTVGTKFIIRYEGVDKNYGGDGAAPSRIWEIHFDSENPGEITVLVDGYNIAYSTGIWGIHDGVRWNDIFEPLPYVNQNDNTTYYGVKIYYQGDTIIDKIKFIGAGVETYVTNGEAYVVTSPLHNLLNIDLNDDGDVVIGAGYYGVELKAAHTGNVVINAPDGVVKVFSGKGTAATPGNGSNIILQAGNAYSNGATAYTGGDIVVGAGLGSNGGSNGVIIINSDLVLANSAVINSDAYTVYIKPSSSYVNKLAITPTGDYDIHLYEATTNGAITLGNYGATNFRVYGPGGANNGGGQYGNDIRAELYGNSTFTITTNSGANSWVFESNGAITFPDSTIQTTAYTGPGVKAVALVNTTAYLANSSHEILLCDPNAAGNNITVTLPNTAANGKIYTIKNINDGGYDVYVEANGQPNIIELHGAGTFNTYDNISTSGNVVSWVYYNGYYRVVSYG